MGFSLPGAAIGSLWGPVGTAVGGFAGDALKGLFGGGSSQQSSSGGGGRAYASMSANPGMPAPYDDSANRASIDAMNRQIAALNAQIAAQPRLLNFNSSNAWAQARQRAEAAVTPHYQAKLQHLVDSINLKRETSRGGWQRDTQIADTGLKMTMEDIATNRLRTGEDVAQNLENVANQQEQFQTDTGEQFDTERQQASAELANAGLATSGIGAQQVGQMQQKRNTQEQRQEQQFQLQEKMQQQFKNRTFEDLSKKETRSKEQTDFQKEKLTFDLNQALKAHDLEQYWGTEEIGFEKQRDIYQNSSGQYQAILGEFLQGQQGKARAQDIALTKQIYGI